MTNCLLIILAVSEFEASQQRVSDTVTSTSTFIDLQGILEEIMLV